MRLPAKFPLRRILRRLPPQTAAFSQKTAIVRDPTRGAFHSGVDAAVPERAGFSLSWPETG